MEMSGNLLGPIFVAGTRLLWAHRGGQGLSKWKMESRNKRFRVHFSGLVTWMGFRSNILHWKTSRWKLVRMTPPYTVLPLIQLQQWKRQHYVVHCSKMVFREVLPFKSKKMRWNGHRQRTTSRSPLRHAKDLLERENLLIKDSTK